MMMVLIFANRSLEPLVGCSEAARRRGVALWSRWGAPCNSRHIHQLPALLQKWWRVAKMQRCCCMYLHVFACTQIYIEYNTCSEMWCDGETEKSPIVQTYHFFIGIGVICKYLVPRLLVFNTQYFLYFNHWYEEKHEDFYFYVCSCNNRFFFVVQLMSFVYSKVSLLFF